MKFPLSEAGDILDFSVESLFCCSKRSIYKSVAAKASRLILQLF